MRYMKVAVFIEPRRIALQERPVPPVSTGEARIRITTTTICSTDVHILKGEYPVEPGGSWVTNRSASLVTHRFKLDQIEEAYDLQLTKR